MVATFLGSVWVYIDESFPRCDTPRHESEKPVALLASEKADWIDRHVAKLGQEMPQVSASWIFESSSSRYERTTEMEFRDASELVNRHVEPRLQMAPCWESFARHGSPRLLGLGCPVHHGAPTHCSVLDIAWLNASSFFFFPLDWKAMEGGLVLWQVSHMKEFFRSTEMILTCLPCCSFAEMQAWKADPLEHLPCLSLTSSRTRQPDGATSIEVGSCKTVGECESTFVQIGY